MKTTLNKIRKYAPCTGGWTELLKHLGKTQADDEPLSIATIVESNGLDDAIWCLRAVDGHDKEIRLFAVWCARQVQHLMKDQRSIAALDVAERHAHGEATDAELNAAHAAARAAALDAALDAAWDAAWAVANAAADTAAWVAAEAVAGAAADAAAWGAALDAAWDAARDAAHAAAKGAQAKELLRICAEIEAQGETK